MNKDCIMNKFKVGDVLLGRYSGRTVMIIGETIDIFKLLCLNDKIDMAMDKAHIADIYDYAIDLEEYEDKIIQIKAELV